METEETIFPQKSKLVIGKIVEQYGFKKVQDEEIKKFFKAKTPKERGEILINLPGAKISKLVREYAEGKFSLENLSKILEKSLGIPSKKAKEMAEELKKELFLFIKPIKKKKLPTYKTKIKITPPKESKRIKKADVYRESIK